MIMKQYFNAILVAVLTLAMTACVADFADRNTNPEQATDEMLDHDGLRVGSPLAQMMANVIPSYQNNDQEEYGSANYQVAQGLNGNIFANYEGASNSGFAQNNLYNLNPDGWSKAMFNDAYTRAISPWIGLNEIREEAPEAVALADILKVAVLSRVTDVYGPIPYSQLTTGSLTVAYDSQEQVYTQMFKELGEAIDLLSAAPKTVFAPIAGFDRVFYGDAVKWIQFANTLRLRLATRVAYVNEELYKSEAAAALANENGLLTENAMLHKGSGAWENPIFVIEYNFNDGDAKAGATIVTYMNSYSDPRRPAFFTAGSDGNYYGVRMGATVSTDYPKSTLWSKVKCTNDDPLLWMSGAESFFLKAEYYLRTGDAAQAQENYEAGVQKSFELWGVSGADTYLAVTDPVGTYTDPVTSGNSYNTALTAVSVAWDSQSDDEGHLEQIITQKYLAGFPEGEEAWAEFRRTGYPRVIPVRTNNSGGTINTDLQVRRLPYPIEESQANGANLTAGIALLRQESANNGGDNGGTRLWWDKNPRF